MTRKPEASRRRRCRTTHLSEQRHGATAVHAGRDRANDHTDNTNDRNDDNGDDNDSDYSDDVLFPHCVICMPHSDSRPAPADRPSCM